MIKRTRWWHGLLLFALLWLALVVAATFRRNRLREVPQSALDLPHQHILKDAFSIEWWKDEQGQAKLTTDGMTLTPITRPQPGQRFRSFKTIGAMRLVGRWSTNHKLYVMTIMPTPSMGFAQKQNFYFSPNRHVIYYHYLSSFRPHYSLTPFQRFFPMLTAVGFYDHSSRLIGEGQSRGNQDWLRWNGHPVSPVDFLAQSKQWIQTNRKGFDLPAREGTLELILP
ncbi:MAG: hypothetical protein AAF492_03360 [Verrucomicrobiota bacterium]